uniref:Uncharacterized protein n=1 Tax=Ciona savignyi TaxID=51511 RepID=H2YTB4_CIOSA
DPTCEDTYCLDGNFGLVRRLAAGTKKTEPHHNKKLFLQDDETSTFINNYCDKDKHTQNCSDFQAGDKVRSKSKNKKLDVKGIFGCCCRHEFPKLFMDLKHGERLGYPVFLLKKLLEQNSNTNVKVFYDIACRLEDHLRVSYAVNKPIFLYYS